MACWSDIEGTWSYQDMIGSKFKLKSIAISRGGIPVKYGDKLLRYSQIEMTVKDIHFRASCDGKVIPLFEMEGICGSLFVPRDLELVEVNKFPDIPAISGRVICGKAYCGNRIDLGDAFEEKIKIDELNPNVSIVTEESKDKEEEITFSDQVNSWEIIGL